VRRRWFGGQAIGNVTLDHCDDPLRRLGRFEPARNQRCRDVVRQIAGRDPRASLGERGVVHREGVGQDDIGSAEILALAQDFSERRIDLDRRDRRAALQQRARQGAGAGADLDDVCSFFRRAESRDASRRGAVGQEVLAEAFLRAQAARCEQRARVIRWCGRP
jgi:hypothetical protein